MARPRIQEAGRSSGAKPCFAKCASLTLRSHGAAAASCAV